MFTAKNTKFAKGASNNKAQGLDECSYFLWFFASFARFAVVNFSGYNARPFAWMILSGIGRRDFLPLVRDQLFEFSLVPKRKLRVEVHQTVFQEMRVHKGLVFQVNVSP